MTFQRFVAMATCACGLAFAAASAQAQTDTYRIEANSTHTTELSICNPAVEVHLNGDDDTDLDYVIRNSRGDVVHSDYGLSDETRATLYRDASKQCEDFTVQTTNLGNVWNAMDIALNTVQGDSGNPINTATYRVEAKGRHGVDFSICSPEVRIDVRGDGDTDLDFVVSDANGNVVHSDYGLTDQASFTIARRSDMECEQFSMETINLGDVYNLYQVQMEDIVQDAVFTKGTSRRD